jgi:hypothetical protein
VATALLSGDLGGVRVSWEVMNSMPWFHEYLSFGDYPAVPDIVKTLFTCK